MILGILSDTHSRQDTTAAALALFREHRAERLIHCGDIDSAEMVAAFSGWPVEFVLGNCDPSAAAMSPAIEAIGAALHPHFGVLQVDGLQIVWHHGHEYSLKAELERSGFDYVFTGHTHVAEERLVGKTWCINPGALQRARIKSIGLLDTATRTYRRIDLPE